MTETPQSYRTLSGDDAIELRVQRVVELERSHYQLVLLAEENGGRLDGADESRRLRLESAIMHHSAVLWPDPGHDDDASTGGDASPAAPGHVDAATGPRGTAVEPDPTASPWGEMPDPLLFTTADPRHTAHHDDGPVEPDDERVEGDPLGAITDEPDGRDDDPDTGRHAEDDDHLHRQRVSHFPSVRDVMGVQ